ncbi:hypothetical protein [Dechloromonas sp. HYN0024]|uniref:hypothetical protein n=1 Tax=Dechloromonas sp. HYN0024 TaxID=2231055 RepID=UPI0013C2ECBD|nr:hypothetical protein [Dechloromonas sp. HYN0024]
MSVSIELLDAFKAALGGISDYRAAKLLLVKQPTMSGWRNERGPMSPEKVLLACELSGLDAVDWLLRLYRERARCDKEKQVLDTLRSRAAA